jgi:hypothetical protein
MIPSTKSTSGLTSSVESFTFSRAYIERIHFLLACHKLLLHTKFE